MEEALRRVALKEDLIASHREVGEWVLSLIGEELSARRKAVRAASSARTTDPSRLLRGTESQPSLSGQVAASGPWTPVSYADPPISVQMAAPAPRRPRYALIVGAAVGVLALLGLVAAVALRSGKQDEARGAASGTSQAVAPAQAAPIATGPLAPAASTTATAALAVPVAITATTQAPPFATFKPPLARTKTGYTPAASAAPATSAPATAWDNTSPLPPP